jgi:hypothetical protein
VARKRDLKHSFFTNEDLADLHPLTRLMFQAMWCVADRRGILADRPRRIKIECLPFDDHDVEGALTDLERGGFITRYEVGGVAVIQVCNWRSWQGGGSYRPPRPYWSADEREYIGVIQRDPCAYCGAPFKQIDHIAPFSKVGHGDPMNLTASCASCNNRKGTKSVLAFMLEEAA